MFSESEFEGCAVSYFGEGKPEMKLKEKINSEGYKNDFTEYLPVNNKK